LEETLQRVNEIFRSETHAHNRFFWIAVIFLLVTGFLTTATAQDGNSVDIARQAVVQIPSGANSMSMSIYGVTLGMPWGEARNVLDRLNVPYIFQKGTSPVVYVPPQNSTYYYILNPSSYEIIEMGIIGVADLPLDNQYLYDGQRWRLTTARTQFFGNEGEFIVNEEGESYNFPYLGFVLKYVTPGTFRFVMVRPTNKPLTQAYSREPIVKKATEKQVEKVVIVEREQQDELKAWLDNFQAARNQFEMKKYRSALASFQHIRDQAPDALLRVRSMYWMGECFYGLKQFKSAIQQFERVLAETDIDALREPATLMLSRSRKKAH